MGQFWVTKEGQHLLKSALVRNHVFRVAILRYGSSDYVRRNDGRILIDVFFRMEPCTVIFEGYMQHSFEWLRVLRGKIDGLVVGLVTEVECILACCQQRVKVHEQFYCKMDGVYAQYLDVSNHM